MAPYSHNTKDAISCFARALKSSPWNPVTLRNLATQYFKLWWKRGEHVENAENMESKKEYILHLYNLALEKDPKDTHTLFQGGEFLAIIGDTVAAVVSSFELACIDFAGLVYKSCARRHYSLRGYE